MCYVPALNMLRVSMQNIDGAVTYIVVPGHPSCRLHTIVFLFFLVFVQGVLKWAHHPFLKNVMLWHPVAPSHNSLHLSMLDAFLEDLFRGTSPARVLH